MPILLYLGKMSIEECHMSQLADINRVAELEVDANKLIVAFANSDGEIVNQHFGSSLGFHAWQYRYAIGG